METTIEETVYGTYTIDRQIFQINIWHLSNSIWKTANYVLQSREAALPTLSKRITRSFSIIIMASVITLNFWLRLFWAGYLLWKRIYCLLFIKQFVTFQSMWQLKKSHTFLILLTAVQHLCRWEIFIYFFNNLQR